MSRAPYLRIGHDELIVDNFAGGGGASLGIEWGLGRSPDIAINHDPEAIAMHRANHPGTRHYCEDVWKVDPVQACGGRPVGLAWFSPDCKHFSKAKGGKPVDKKIRGLAWVVIRWAKAVQPRVICLENVEEFEDWGPVLDNGKPCPHRVGLTFRIWKGKLESLGYKVEWRELIAADYGTPTTRKRLFLVARRDGLPIVWPRPSHSKDGKGYTKPWIPAAQCIDFSLPTYSIFLTRDEARAYGVKRPLAENTMRRVARGLKRFVLDNPRPFIVPVMHGDEARVWDIDEPMRTITGAARGDRALVTPYLAGVGGRKGQSPETPIDRPYHTITAKGDTVLVTPYLTEHANGSSPRSFAADEPLRTQCAQVKGGHFALVAPTLIQTGYGERPGQAPRAPGLDKPLGTIVGGGQKHALVAAFLAKHYGGHETPGSDCGASFDTITSRDHHALVASSLVKLKGTAKDGQQLDLLLHTVQAGGNHYAEMRAFLIKYYGTDQDPRLDEPLHTLTSRDRMGLVTVMGATYALADVGMRMLAPPELYLAQGFPPGYIIAPEYEGRPLTKDAQVRMCGNSVCPPNAAALARAQFEDVVLEVRA